MKGATLDLLVDYDDVLYPWSTRAHELCVAAGITNGKTVTQWHMWEDYGCESEVLWEVLRAGTLDGTLYDAPMIPGAIIQLHRLRNLGHRVHIVTARGFGEHGELIQAITRDQIRSENVPLDSLTFAKDKAAVAAELGERVAAVDDGFHNYDALDAAGAHVSLMDACHNQSRQDVRRVMSMKQWADHTIELASVLV
jgi:hypothetical protein